MLNVVNVSLISLFISDKVFIFVMKLSIIHSFYTERGVFYVNLTRGMILKLSLF